MFKKWKIKRAKKKLRRRLNQSLFLLARMDSAMKGWPSWKQKQFWRDFIKSPRSRQRVFKDLFEKING